MFEIKLKLFLNILKLEKKKKTFARQILLVWDFERKLIHMFLISFTISCQKCCFASLMSIILKSVLK